MKISADFLNNFKNIKFKNSSEIQLFFTKLPITKGLNFVKWFNGNISLKGYFAQNGRLQPIGYINEANFNKFWDNISVVFNKPEINFFEFIALNTIICNETGASYYPLTEGVNGLSENPAVNPGISYAFNLINGIKYSYNEITGNETCYDLFNNADYISAHGDEKFASLLKNTHDLRWRGKTFPYGFSKGKISDEVKKDASFITEADFFKFRGRGYIQTTFRIGYTPLIQAILKYNGINNQTINQYKSFWTTKYAGDVNKIATCSKTADWDILFQNSNFIIPSLAIWLHSTHNGNYLNINAEDKPDNIQNGILNYAKRIAGGGASNYHTLYMNRIFQIFTGLGNK